MENSYRKLKILYQSFLCVLYEEERTFFSLLLIIIPHFNDETATNWGFLGFNSTKIGFKLTCAKSRCFRSILAKFPGQLFRSFESIQKKNCVDNCGCEENKKNPNKATKHVSCQTTRNRHRRNFTTVKHCNERKPQYPRKKD